MSGGDLREVSQRVDFNQCSPPAHDVLSCWRSAADQLAISFDTVRFHLKHIYQKLHFRSRSEALIKYLR
jgi:hypothetical protein